MAVALACACNAAIMPITSVNAGVDGSPPYMLQSITVGTYTVLANQLVTGTSSGSAGRGTVIENADDLDLNTIIIRTPRSDPIWTIVSFGGQPLWYDTNGADPDFFFFEVGMNDAFTMQAILAGGTLGQAVTVDAGLYGAIGYHPTLQAAGGQEIGGLCFETADLLDAQGNALTRDVGIEGIRVDGPLLDPASFVVFIPEPATVLLLVLGAAGIRSRKAG